MEYIAEDCFSEEHHNSPFILNQYQLRSIWRAVITQAIIDAASNSKKAFDKRNKTRALLWLENADEDFQEVCNLAEFETEYIMQKTKQALQNGCIWKKDIRLIKRKTSDKISTNTYS